MEVRCPPRALQVNAASVGDSAELMLFTFFSSPLSAEKTFAQAVPAFCLMKGHAEPASALRAL